MQLEEIVRSIPKKVVDDKLRVFRSARYVPEKNSFEYNGYTFGLSLRGHQLKVTVEQHSSEVLDLPNYSRVGEAIEEAVKYTRKVQEDVNLSSAQLNRATNQVGKGRIKTLNDKNCGTIPSKLEIVHKIDDRESYNPAEVFQAVWDVALRPLLLVAQNYPISTK